VPPTAREKDHGECDDAHVDDGGALENEGAVESYQTATEGGRKRKYYHLTNKGQKQLAAETAEWRKYEHAINAVLSMG
jgi:PadR family transcriptional regulator PadR